MLGRNVVEIQQCESATEGMALEIHRRALQVLEVIVSKRINNLIEPNDKTMITDFKAVSKFNPLQISCSDD